MCKAIKERELIFLNNILAHVLFSDRFYNMLTVLITMDLKVVSIHRN